MCKIKNGTKMEEIDLVGFSGMMLFCNRFHEGVINRHLLNRISPLGAVRGMKYGLYDSGCTFFQIKIE